MTCRHTTGSRSRRSPWRAGSVVCVAAVMTMVLSACGDDSTPSTSGAAGAAGAAGAPSTSIAGIPGIDPLACDPATAAPGETVTNGPGSHDSAVSVVADYHWAVITARDTARATDAVAPGNAMARPQLIAEAFDGFPAGTTYCLRLRQTAPQTVVFTLTYKPPTGTTGEYRLRASVTGSAGAVRMTGEVEQ